MSRFTTRSHPFQLAAVAATMVVLAAACGSDKDASTATSGSTAAPVTTAAPATPTSAPTSTAAPDTTGASPTTAAATGELQTGLGNAGGGAMVDDINDEPPYGPVGTGLTRGITGDSVKIGCVYTAAAYTGFETGIKAKFDAVNKAGGINGRTLELVPCRDDASDPQTHLQNVQQLVNQDKVFGMFTLGNVELPPATDFLNNNQVPYYGWGFEPGFCGDRWGFGWNGCVAGTGIAQSEKYTHAAIQANLALAIMKATGMEPSDVRLALISQDNSAGNAGKKQQGDLFEAVGATVVYNEAVFPDQGSPDVTPYVQAILATDPNLVYLSTPFNNVGPMAAGLKAAGYKGVTMDFTNYIPGLLEAAPQLANALQGQYVNTQVVPQEQQTPFIKQIETDLKAINADPLITLGLEIGYIEAQLLVEQLQAVGEKLDTKTFDDTVNGGDFSSFGDLDGGPGKLVWPAAHVLPADCAAVVRINGTKYDLKEPFSCYESYKAW
jgi:branched-chain amino acid transport system substrate-binding protein